MATLILTDNTVASSATTARKGIRLPGTGDLGGQRIERADLMSQAGRQLAQGHDRIRAEFIRRALAATVGLAAIANVASRFSSRAAARQ